MKKLNRKGFTLVELLAVIIILAIVVGITIPAITNIINDSKNSALQVACDSAADYLSDQYAMMNVDYDMADSDFTRQFHGHEGETITLNANVIKNAGFRANNVTTVVATVELDGTVCVRVTAIPNNSEYYSTTHWTTGGTAKDTATNYSKSCTNTPVATPEE